MIFFRSSGSAAHIRPVHHQRHDRGRKTAVFHPGIRYGRGSRYARIRTPSHGMTAPSMTPVVRPAAPRDRHADGGQARSARRSWSATARGFSARPDRPSCPPACPWCEFIGGGRGSAADAHPSAHRPGISPEIPARRYSTGARHERQLEHLGQRETAGRIAQQGPADIDHAVAGLIKAVAVCRPAASTGTAAHRCGCRIVPRPSFPHGSSTPF